MPEKKKLLKYIDQIYENDQITNNGPLVRLLEKKLSIYFGTDNVVLVTNGTIALEIVYKALNLTGNVITTPFSYVATTSSLKWIGADPVFADIDPKSFNINPKQIENISSNVSGIVATHVFGNPCEIEKIENIADQKNLPVVYDASHGFHIQYKNKHLVNYGTVSTLSFHATKVFHTIEGGAIITSDPKIAENARLIRNFGLENGEIKRLGSNGKMSEFQAAMGLCMLDEFPIALSKRQEVYERYEKALSPYVEMQKRRPDTTNNYAYFPILLKDKQTVLKVIAELKNIQADARRYFYPSLNTVDYVNSRSMSVSEDIASRILCLPMHHAVEKDAQKHLISLTLKTIK